MGLFAAAVFVDVMAWGHIAAFTPLYLREELGVPEDQIPLWAGVLAAAPLFIAVPLSPFWGVLAERYARKPIIVRAMFAAAVGYGLAAFAQDPWGLLLSRVAFGLTFGHVAVMLATQSLITPGRRLGSALGVIQAAMPAATAASPLWGALLVQTVGLRMLWVVDAAVLLVLACAVTFLLKEPNVPRSVEPVLNRVRQVATVTVSQPTVRWSFVAWFLVYCGAGAIDPFVPVLIQSLYEGPDPAVAIGLVLAAYGLVTSAATVVVGRLSDRAGPARVLIVSCALLAIVVAAIGFSPTLTVLAALTILRAIPQAGTGPALYLHLARVLPPSHRASIMGFTPLSRNAAYLVAPMAAAALSGFGLPVVFVLGAGCYTLAVVAARLMGRAPAFMLAPEAPQRRD